MYKRHLPILTNRAQGSAPCHYRAKQQSSKRSTPSFDTAFLHNTTGAAIRIVEEYFVVIKEPGVEPYPDKCADSATAYNGSSDKSMDSNATFVFIFTLKLFTHRDGRTDCRRRKNKHKYKNATSHKQNRQKKKGKNHHRQQNDQIRQQIMHQLLLPQSTFTRPKRTHTTASAISTRYAAKDFTGPSKRPLATEPDYI